MKTYHIRYKKILCVLCLFMVQILALNGCGSNPQPEVVKVVETTETVTSTTEETPETNETTAKEIKDSKNEDNTSEATNANNATALNADKEITENSDNPILIDGDSMEAYNAFLSGKFPLYFDNYQVGNFKEATPYYMDDVLNEWTKNDEYTSYSDVKYAYIDCGNDGEPEMIFAYSLENEISELEGFYDIETIIKFIDGKLQTCGEAVSHYRSYESINKYGIITSSFSDFAGGHLYTGYTGVNAKGELDFIFTQEEAIGEAINGVYQGYGTEKVDFRDAYEGHEEEFNCYSIYSLDIAYGNNKGQKIYSYQKWEENDLDLNIILDTFNRAGVIWYPFDNYTEAMNSVIKEYGLSPAQFNADSPEFISLNVE